jgi:hypothetical protein
MMKYAQSCWYAQTIYLGMDRERNGSRARPKIKSSRAVSELGAAWLRRRTPDAISSGNATMTTVSPAIAGCQNTSVAVPAMR